MERAISKAIKSIEEKEVKTKKLWEVRRDAKKHKVLDLRRAFATLWVRQAHGLAQRTPQAEAPERIQGERAKGRAGEAEKALDYYITWKKKISVQ